MKLRPLPATVVVLVQLFFIPPADAQEKVQLLVDAPRAAACPVTVRFKATIPPQSAESLEYRFIGSDGTTSVMYKLALKGDKGREIHYARTVGEAGGQRAAGWVDLEYKVGGATRKVRAQYALECVSDDRKRADGPVAGKTVLLDVKGEHRFEEDLLEEFGDNYLDRRGYSLKKPLASSRIQAYERLKEMRRALRVKHHPAEWRNGPGGPGGGGGPEGPGAPGALDANNCAWSSLGPTNINGRITGIAVDPSNNQRVFATTVGGIWRSVNGGRRWQRVSDDFLSTVFASVAVNPSMGTEVFAGGGDPNYHGGWRGGLGILRSTAGGDPGSWTAVSPPALLNQVIYRILIDPTPPNDVYAATSTGVYIGTRSGATITFARLGAFDAWTSDIAVDFSVTPRLVYAGVRSPSVSFGRGIWKYDGTSWNDRSTGIATASSRTITLALAPSAHATLYAKVEADTGHLQGMYKTTTAAETPMGGGNAWSQLAGAAGLDDSCAGTFCYSWYNFALAVDPANADIVWAGALGMYRTIDGGTSWPVFWTGPNANMPVGLHSDHHAIAFDPANSKIVYVGNDGGIFKSTDTSLASWNWTDISHGMIVTEYYRSTSQQAMANIMAGGTQDNGTVLTFGNRTWYEPGGCDGANVAIDAADASTVYGYCNGSLYELANPVPGTVGGGSQIAWTLPAGVTMISPLVTDDGVVGAALSGGWTQAGPMAPRVYRVMKTTDGVNWNDIGPPIPDNTSISAIGIAPSSAFMTYYVAAGGTIWRTTTGAAPWTSASAGLPATNVNAIYVDAANPARALAATSGGLFLTIDTGANWNPINGTGASALPTLAVTGAVFDPSDPNTAHAVTDIGAFRGTITPAMGATPPSGAWVPYDEGLPDGLDINDLWVNRTTKALKIGTMGHGAYLRDIRPAITCPAAHLLVRDNIYDRGTTPSPSGVPDPEHPIPDPARPNFYKPDDTQAGRAYWWQSADIRIDVPSAAPPKNQVASADHVEAQSCPIHLSDCPAGTIRDADPERGSAARVYVNVNNAGLASASNVRVVAMYADASGGLPPLPADFWTTTFPAGTTTCGALDTSTGWHFADSATPCKVIPVVNPDLPEIARFDWSVPMGQAGHSCMFVVVESNDDPIDASIRTTNETNVNTLVPNHRHVSLRNLHVIDTPPAPAGGGTPQGAGAGVEPMHIGNPYDKSRRIELVVSRAGLAKDATLALILPAVQGMAVQGARRFDPRLREEEARKIRALKLDPRAAFAIPAGAKEASFVIEVPAKANLTAAWVYRAGKPQMGSSGRWTVLQRSGDQVLGGNTYFLRVASTRR